MRNFTELDMYLFGQGTHYDIGKKLGAHFAKDENGLEGVVCLMERLILFLSVSISRILASTV